MKGVARAAKRQRQRSFQSLGCRYHGQNGCSRRTEGTTGLTVGLEARVRRPRRDSEVQRGKVPARNERAQKRRPSLHCRVAECGRKTSPPGIVASSSFPPRREVIVPAPRLPRRRWARPRLLWPLSLLTWKVRTERLLDPSVCVPFLKLRFYSAVGQHVGAPHTLM